MSDSNYIHNSHNVSHLVYHFVTTVGKAGSEEAVRRYVQNRGKQDECEQLFFRHLGKYSAPVNAREGARRKMPSGHFRALPGEIYYSSNLKY